MREEKVTNTLYQVKKTICPTKSKEVLSQVTFLEAGPEMIYFRKVFGRRGAGDAGRDRKAARQGEVGLSWTLPSA